MKTERRDRGATIPLVAILLPVVILMTSFAVDLGRQRASRRNMQADADIVALDMTRLADGRTEAEILGDPEYGGYLQGSADRNDIDVTKVSVVFGTWSEESGFIACRPDPMAEPLPSETCTPNAAEVSADESIDYFFQPGSGETHRDAVATFQEASGCFSLGSFAAGLTGDTDTILNMLLGDLMGVSPTLQVLGYDGLAAADINLLDLIGALPGIGTPQEVLGAAVTVGELYAAVVEVLPQDDPGNIEVALLEMITANPPVLQQPIVVGDLISINPGGEGAALDTDINVLDVIAGGLLLADGSHALNLNGLGVSLAGVSLSATATLIEAIKTHCGPVGDSQTTDQIKLDIAAALEVDAGLLKGLLQPVNGALGGVLTPVIGVLDGLLGLLTGLTCALLGIGCPDDPLVEIGIAVRGAGATAGLDAIECPDGEPQAELSTTTQLAMIDIGVTIAGEELPPLIHLQLDGMDEVHFTDPSQPLPQTIPFGRDDLGLTDADLTVLGLALGPILNPILAPLDELVLSPLLDVVGLDIAGGDVVMESAICGGIHLVR